MVRDGHDPGELARKFEPSAQSIRTWVTQADGDDGRCQDGLASLCRGRANMVQIASIGVARYTRMEPCRNPTTRTSRRSSRRAIYKQRAVTAETVNADAKAHRGFDRLTVRGLDKVLGSASLFALTYQHPPPHHARRLTA